MTKVRTLNPLERETLLMYVGIRRSINSKNPRTRVIVTNAISKGTKHKIAGTKP